MRTKEEQNTVSFDRHQPVFYGSGHEGQSQEARKRMRLQQSYPQVDVTTARSASRLDPWPIVNV